jgi:hypothetical protein
MSRIPYEREEREREREIMKEYGLGGYLRYVSSSPN